MYTVGRTKWKSGGGQGGGGEEREPREMREEFEIDAGGMRVGRHDGGGEVRDRKEERGEGGKNGVEARGNQDVGRVEGRECTT